MKDISLNVSKIKYWKRAATAVGLGLLLTTAPSQAVTPMMDTDQFKDSRLAASNLTRSGFFAEAVQTEEKAYRLAQAQLGPLHPSLAPILADIGNLYHTLADYPKAEQSYKWGLALAEKNFGPDHTTVADFLDKLSYLYLDLNRNTEAEILEKRAVRIKESNSSSNSRALIQSWEIMGMIKSNLNQFDQALVFFQKAFGKLDTENQSDAPRSIELLRKIAQCRLAGKDFSQAQADLEKALGLAQKVYPADGAEVADGMEKLGDFFHAQKRDDKAKPFYDSAHQTYLRLVGTNYSYPSLPYVRRLAQSSYVTGDFKNAEFLWLKSIKIEKETLGASHPKAAFDLVSLSDAEKALGKKAKAREALQDALIILKAGLTKEDPRVILIQKRLE